MECASKGPRLREQRSKYEKQDKSPVNPSGALSVSEIGRHSPIRIWTPDKPESAVLDYNPLLLHRLGLEDKMGLHLKGCWKYARYWVGSHTGLTTY